jgi:hypothetical protein
MAAHPVDDNQQGCLLGCNHRSAVLVVLAVTNQTQICMLNPQSAAPAEWLFSLLHLPAPGGALYTGAASQVRPLFP